MTAVRTPAPTSPVHVGASSRHGRGVFSNAALPAGTVVEVSPMLLITREEGDRDDLFGRYIFEWDVDADPTAYALALGWGSLFNHSGDPSCGYTRADDDETLAASLAVGAPGGVAACAPGMAPALIFTTVRPVAAGEELTIDYSGVGEEDMWFGVTG
jgi:SET domain-containing protein